MPGRSAAGRAPSQDFNIYTPFQELAKEEQDWVLYGENPGVPGEELWKDGKWYGVKGFFDWLETKTYKMHVRVLLSRYRTYTVCPDCRGGRYQAATLNFRWLGKTLPELQGLLDRRPAEGGLEWRGAVAR